jgi:Protein of unknown function (DUF2958)
MQLESLKLIATPKSKFTLLVVGGGWMGCDVRKLIVAKGWLGVTSGGEKLCYSDPRGRKIYNLMSILQAGAIVLRGHEESRPVFESHARVAGGFRSFIMDGVGGRFIDYNGEGTDALIAYLKKHLVLHTLNGGHTLTLLNEMAPATDSGGTGQRGIADPNFKEKLLTALGPAVALERPELKEPERKELLTDVMKMKLLAAQGKPAQPIYKIFGGAGTWLLCSLDDDGDTLWAVCDLGMGCVEYGTVSLKELETTRIPPFKLALERDKFFDGSELKMEELLAKDSLMA